MYQQREVLDSGRVKSAELKPRAKRECIKIGSECIIIQRVKRECMNKKRDCKHKEWSQTLVPR